MQVELRKIKHYPELSEDTECYTAELYIDDEHAANVRNNGVGDTTRITALPTKMKKLLHAVGAYYKTLPDEMLPGTKQPVSMKLESHVDNLLHQFVVHQQRQQLLEHLEKLSKDCILYGDTIAIEQFRQGKTIELLVGRIYLGSKLIDIPPNKLRVKLEHLKKEWIKPTDSIYNDLMFLDMLYEPVVEINMEEDWSVIQKNLAINFAELNRIDQLAKSKADYLYRYFTVPVADGCAYYQIIDIDYVHATVRICYGISADEYHCPTLGTSSTIPLYKMYDLLISRD